MRKIFLITVIAVVFISCAHEQFRAYLLNADSSKRQSIRKNPGFNNIIDNVNDQLSYDHDFVLVKKSFSREFPSFDLYQKNMKVLASVKKDLETFYLIAKHLRKYNRVDDLKYLDEFADNYISNRVDLLLFRNKTTDSADVKKLLLELQYMKALLLFECKHVDHACDTLKNLEFQYHHNRYVNVDFMGNKFKDESPYMALTYFKLLCRSKDKLSWVAR